MPTLFDYKCILVACGREFTLIATKPYVGPSEEEVESMKADAAMRAAAIQKTEEALEERQAAQVLIIKKAQRRLALTYLNTHHPLCQQCKVAGVCAGFQRDEIDPDLCKHCLHEKAKHVVLYHEQDKQVTLESLQLVVNRLQIDLDWHVPEEDNPISF